MIYKIIIAVLLLTFFSCTTEITTRNAKEDILQVEEFVKQFYGTVKQRGIKEAKKFFGGEFASEMSQADGEELLKKVKKLLGESNEIEIKTVKTENKTTNGKQTLLAEVELIVDFERGKTKEFLTIETRDSTLKIIGYLVRLSEVYYEDTTEHVNKIEKKIINEDRN